MAELSIYIRIAFLIVCLLFLFVETEGCLRSDFRRTWNQITTNYNNSIYQGAGIPGGLCALILISASDRSGAKRLFPTLNPRVFKPFVPILTTIPIHPTKTIDTDRTAGDYKVQHHAEMVAGLGYIISTPLLLITFVIYTILPELRNIHGVTLRGYVGCLLASYIIMVLLDCISVQPCVYIGSAYYFSLVAGYFWLNVMCFDIWWTFRGFRPLRENSTPQMNRKKFIIYSIYVWGSATIISTIWALRTSVFDTLDAKMWKAYDCYWYTEFYYEYIYAPIGATLLCNMILFLLTFTKIIRHNQMTARHLEGTKSRRVDDKKQWLGLYLKLFVLMGMIWCLKMIQWFTGYQDYMYYLYEWGTAYQGVIIFIMFICKRNILRSLKKRCCCRGRNNISRSSGRGDYRSSTPRTSITTVSDYEKTNSLPERY